MAVSQLLTIGERNQARMKSYNKDLDITEKRIEKEVSKLSNLDKDLKEKVEEKFREEKKTLKDEIKEKLDKQDDEIANRFERHKKSMNLRHSLILSPEHMT